MNRYVGMMVAAGIGAIAASALVTSTHDMGYRRAMKDAVEAGVAIHNEGTGEIVFRTSIPKTLELVCEKENNAEILQKKAVEIMSVCSIIMQKQLKVNAMIDKVVSKDDIDEMITVEEKAVPQLAPPEYTTLTAMQIAHRIGADIYGRAGIGVEWSLIDSKDQLDIMTEWCNIIQNK